MRLISSVLLLISLLLSSTTASANVAICLDKGRESHFRVDELLKEVDQAFALVQKKKDGSESVLPATNFYANLSGRVLEWARPMVRVLLKDPNALNRLNGELTDALERLEMSFMKKVGGKYATVFTPKVNAAMVPLPRGFYDKIVQSTEPIMQSMRKILQVVFSHQNLTVELMRSELRLPKSQVPDAKIQELIDIIKETVYLEPALVHKNMKNYPFNSVVGFDTAINLAREVFRFFEFNAGTPSGLSNNIQLLELMRVHRPEIYEQIVQYLVKDSTFAILRETMESNAAAWTGRKDGEIVVFGPGQGNGAHPDVAAISRFSNLLMGKFEEHYVDRQGWVRRNTGPGKKHPVVTGAYMRVEESYVIQDSRLGIKIRDPDKGVLDIESTYKLGRDPSRPDVEPGSLAEAILKKKFYTNVVGGRVLDDKRLFQIIAEFIAPVFVRRGADPANIARPPRTLERNEYETFYESKSLENFVVKEPAESGGVGVYLLVNLPKTSAEVKRPQFRTQDELFEHLREHPEHVSQQDVVAMVKSNPDLYVIQEFFSPSLITTTYGKTPKFVTVTGDLRVFVFMDARGRVRAGSQSFLARVAEYGKASSNTSQGAGYGIFIVVNDVALKALRGAKDLARKSVLPPMKAEQPLGVTRQGDLKAFLYLLVDSIFQTSPHSKVALSKESELLNVFTAKHREILDLLHSDLAYLSTDVRAFQAGKMSTPEFHKVLLNYVEKLQKETRFGALGVRKIVRDILRTLDPHVVIDRQGEIKARRTQLRGLITVKRGEVASPVQKYTSYGNQVRVYRTGEILSSNDPVLREMIKEIHSYGAKVIEVRAAHNNAKEWSDQAPAPRFVVNAKGEPALEIDILGIPRAIEAVAHEMAHMRNWYAKYKEYLGKGLRPSEAAKRARDFWIATPERIVRDETDAVTAEMNAATLASPFNHGPIGPRKIGDARFANRTIYPEIEGLRNFLFQVNNRRGLRKKFGGDDDFGVVTMKRAILKAAKIREEAIEFWRNGRDANAQRFLKYFESVEIFRMIFRTGDLSRFQTDQTISELILLYNHSLSLLKKDGQLKGEPKAIESTFLQGQGDQQQQQ